MADESSVPAFGASGGFGTFTGWEMQSDSANTNKQRANALGPTGNEAASTLFDETIAYSTSYKCSANTNSPPDTIGALVNSRILTSISINTSNTDHATMELAGHQHGTTTHADTLQQAAHGVTLAQMFGAVDFMGGTGATGSSLVSGSITIACQHQDETTGAGVHLCGENYNCMMTATTTWTGLVTTPASAGWDVTVVSVPVGNTGFVKTTVTGTKALALASPS